MSRTHIPIERIELQRLKVMVQNHIPFSTFRSALEVETLTDQIMLNLVVRLQSYVLAEEVDKREKVITIECPVPLNWWEHFKLDHFPEWMRQLFGHPKTKTLTFTRKVRFKKLATYPKANLAIPELGDVVVHRTMIEEECNAKKD